MKTPSKVHNLHPTPESVLEITPIGKKGIFTNSNNVKPQTNQKQNKMNTPSKNAIQQMIDFVTSEEYPHLYSAVKDECFKTFLEKEKQQIIDAYNSGAYMSSTKERLDYDEADHKYKNADEYYKQL